MESIYGENMAAIPPNRRVSASIQISESYQECTIIARKVRSERTQNTCVRMSSRFQRINV